jgi:hypothetical protein
VKQIKLAPNTIYAISGVTFVTTEPEARATGWRNLLAPGEQVYRSEIGFDVWVGPHQARWITPQLYQSSYGLTWLPFAYPSGEMGLLHLLASDLRVARIMLEQAGRRAFPVSVRGEEELVIAPDGRDGFSFIIRQQPIEVWLEERMARTGEKFRLADDG